MKKQTAVDWLMDKLPTIDKYDPYYEDIIQQALAMERQQIIEAWKDGVKTDYAHSGTFELYYSQTFTEPKND